MFAAGLAALASGALHSSLTVTGVAMGTLVAMYALDLAGRLADALDPLRWISAFRYYGAPMQNGIDVASFIGLTAAAALLHDRGRAAVRASRRAALAMGRSERALAERLRPMWARTERRAGFPRMAAPPFAPTVGSVKSDMALTSDGAAISDEAREDAREHIRDHARKEAARIDRLSRVREFVLGAQDGLLVPLGVVTGMAAANPGRSAILVAGIAEAVAGCIAMGGGSYLASEAEEGLYAAEIADEGREIDEEPEREIAELALVLEDEGLPREAAERVAHGLAANPTCSCGRRSRRSSASPPTSAAQPWAMRSWSG